MEGSLQPVMKIRPAAMLALLICSCPPTVSAEPVKWPLWEAYTSHFLNPDGRVVDHGRDAVTTSEGQAYALFFALVANDKERFRRILLWTQDNLARGDLSSNLPGWLWGADEDKVYGLRDKNSASDADLWIAYTLLNAGRLWGRPEYVDLGKSVARLIAKLEVVSVPGIGATLLPGQSGFETADAVQLNASYVPLQLLLALSQEIPSGPWTEIAKNVPGVVRGSSPAGFVLDWIAFHPNKGYQLSPAPVKTVLGSYDAIRTYLWAGMLDEATPGREDMLGAMSGMEDYLQRLTYPPSEVAPDGTIIRAESGPGFHAAVLPFLMAHHRTSVAAANLKRVKAERNGEGLYGQKPAYYDQNLVLFSLGWVEKYFQFDAHGEVRLRWIGR
jgi:endo-1,4-beta-D-glucanase Y